MKISFSFSPPCLLERLAIFSTAAVFWNVDPLDWKRKDVGGIVEDVVKNVRSGDIILLHDIYDTSVAAALEIIDRLKDKGFVFVTVDEILIS